MHCKGDFACLQPSSSAPPAGAPSSPTNSPSPTSASPSPASPPTSKPSPHPHRVLVGRDPRFLGETFVDEAARVLAAAGVTPIIIPEARAHPGHRLRRAHSSRPPAPSTSPPRHNPPEYNGIKFSTHDGAPALPEVTKQIEAAIVALGDDRQDPRLADPPTGKFEDGRRQRRLPQPPRRTRRPQGHRQVRHQGGLRSLLGRGPRLLLPHPSRSRRHRRNRPRLPRRPLRRPRARARRPPPRRSQGKR